jgi:hypothetical protein
VSITDALLENARADTDLLQKNDARGDVFTRPRDVDFLLIAPEHGKAELVASFINDNRYGSAKLQTDNAGYGVLVTIHMPIEQNILCSVSALMVCISRLFNVKYDGWGCVLQNGT